MRVEAFLLCWNELDIMPFVLKHYKKFCDKITILDNYSTDGSDKLAESMGCEVIKFGTMFFDDGENMKIKNNCWKGSDSDLVIISDFDELLYLPITNLPDIKTYLWGNMLFNGVTIFKTIGWQIMSDSMPQTDLLEITNGYRFDNYSKSIIFNPKRIKEINYGFGAHKCNPTGDVVWSEDSLYVLHYKHIGGVERTIKRYAQYKPRMSKNNRKFGHGIHYQQTPSKLRLEWQERMKISKPLI